MKIRFRNKIFAGVALAAIASAFGLVRPSGLGAQVSEPKIDDIPCEAMEQLALHIHSHLAIVDHGQQLTIPNDIGRPKLVHCFYWLHTHTPDGIIHIEAPVTKTFTLGQFFDVWGQPLSRMQVASAQRHKGDRVVIWVDGKIYTGLPKAIALEKHRDIVIEVGAPYTKPTPFTEWNGN